MGHLTEMGHLTFLYLDPYSLVQLHDDFTNKNEEKNHILDYEGVIENQKLD